MFGMTDNCIARVQRRDRTSGETHCPLVNVLHGCVNADNFEWPLTLAKKIALLAFLKIYAYNCTEVGSQPVTGRFSRPMAQILNVVTNSKHTCCKIRRDSEHNTHPSSSLKSLNFSDRVSEVRVTLISKENR